MGKSMDEGKGDEVLIAHARGLERYVLAAREEFQALAVRFERSLDEVELRATVLPDAVVEQRGYA